MALLEGEARSALFLASKTSFSSFAISSSFSWSAVSQE